LSSLVLARAARWARAGLLSEMLVPPALSFGQQTLLHSYEGGEAPQAQWRASFLRGTIRGHRPLLLVVAFLSLISGVASRSSADRARGAVMRIAAVILALARSCVLGVNGRRRADLSCRQAVQRHRAAARSTRLINNRVELSIERDAGRTYYDAAQVLPKHQRVIEPRSEVALPAPPPSIQAPHQ
jgi:hypothetical protein